MSFPYITITKEERDKAYEDLVKLKIKKLELKTTGNKASNYYFFKYRIKTRVGKWSRFEAWNNPEQRQKIINTDKQINRNNPSCIGTPSCLNSAMRMRYGSVNQFKPYIAVYIYQKFKPKRILDISAGWGDRLIGAMSQNIDYIGIDSNTNLRKPYNDMINDFKNKTNSKVKMIFSKSENVNYSSLPPYDMIFTSPPYFTLEKYQNMKEYKDYDDFINSYFIPTINKSFKHLLKGGYIILNMPEKMYLSIKPLLGPAKILKMPIRNRFAYKSNIQRTENIYYWKK